MVGEEQVIVCFDQVLVSRSFMLETIAYTQPIFGTFSQR
jgi:hypothetical protein